MNTTIITALIAAVIGFGAAWQIKTWQELENENHRIEAARAAEQELSRMEQKRSAGVIAAQNDARQREIKLRADAVAAVTAADKLRTAIANLVQRNDTGGDASPDGAATQAVVLSECVGELQSLAEKADRHVSDLKTVSAAWPR